MSATGSFCPTKYWVLFLFFSFRFQWRIEFFCYWVFLFVDSNWLTVLCFLFCVGNSPYSIHDQIEACAGHLMYFLGLSNIYIYRFFSWWKETWLLNELGRIVLNGCKIRD
jgi:hypothetical protein